MLVIECPRCTAANPEGSTFCGTCGLRQAGPDGLTVQHAFERSEATRYLCAAMHLDRTMAERVIDEIEDDHHARVSNAGVDLSEVGRHALVARRRQTVRDVALVLDVLAFLFAAALRVTVLAVLLFFGLWVISLVYVFAARYTRLTRSLAVSGGDAVPAPNPSGSRLQGRVAEYGARPYSNVTVYSGFSPFVGLGPVISTWSFSIDTSKPREGVERPQPIRVEEMRRAVIDSTNSLDWHDIVIDDHIFVRGTDIRDDVRFLPNPLGRPVDRVSPALVTQFMVNPDLKARHYLRIRYHSWGEELVVTKFVRFALHGASLFVETAVSVLMPVREEYHQIDDLVFPPTLRQLILMGRTAGVELPKLLYHAPGSALRFMIAPYRRYRKGRGEERAIREHHSFDYGARVTIRERAAVAYRYYFQLLDRDMFTKVLDKRLLDAITEFLQSRGVDTSDLEERTNTILNNGIFVTGGGHFEGGNVAVGDGAAVRPQTAAPSGASKEKA